MAFVGAPTGTRPTCAMDDALAEDVLKRRFGFSRFRGRQADAARAVLAGRDVLYIAATGSGKSLTFQFPTQYLRHAGPRGPASRSTTLVISPLVSLMEDQAAAMRASGVAVAALHGDTPNSNAEWQRALGGAFDLVYITPESALGRLEALRAMAAAGLVDLLAIDEAHCVSEWGADFRPNYRRLAELRAVLPGVPVLALTATATPRVRADIEAQLRLANPLRVVASFNRPNLHYVVRMKTKSMADDLRGALLDPATGTARSGCTIVYCLTVKEVHAVTDIINALRLPVHPARRALLVGGGGGGSGDSTAAAAAAASSSSAAPPTRVLPFGAGAGGSFVSPFAPSLSKSGSAGGDLVLHAAAYHAQMPMGERMEVQKAFTTDVLQVVVATISFGMGVDRRDVRCVAGCVVRGQPGLVGGWVQWKRRQRLASSCGTFLTSCFARTPACPIVFPVPLQARGQLGPGQDAGGVQPAGGPRGPRRRPRAGGHAVEPRRLCHHLQPHRAQRRRRWRQQGRQRRRWRWRVVVLVVVCRRRRRWQQQCRTHRRGGL
jgi:hypothetical protein